MIVNAILLLAFVAAGAWLIVRGVTLGWTTSTVALLCIAIIGAIGRVIAIRREKRQPLGPHRTVDDLLRPPP